MMASKVKFMSPFDDTVTLEMCRLEQESGAVIREELFHAQNCPRWPGQLLIQGSPLLKIII